jgi:histidinol-phosphate aminotransferase
MPIRPKKALLNPDLMRPSALDSRPRSHEMLWLDKNENLDKELLAVATEVLSSIPSIALATYPDAGELYRKLGEWVDVNPENLLLTPGSDGAIRLVFDAFVEKDDSVVHLRPTFAMYEVYAQMFGAKTTQIDYYAAKAGPRIDIDQILSVLAEKAPKLLCIANPDSPTGSVLNADDLERILETCEKFDTILLLDEAYHPFFDWTGVPWTKTSKHLIVVRTFAKAWGAAGLRIGYAVAHPDTAKLLHKLRPMYETSTLAIEFMTRMLDHEQAMKTSVRLINVSKIYFCEEMDKLGFPTLATEGNFCHVAFGEKSGFLHSKLKNHVLYRESFKHPCLAGFTRFSVAPKSVMTQVVEFIRNALEDIE